MLVPGPDLAGRAAALLSLAAATEERSLSELTSLAASQVPGCAAAHVTVWRDGELTNEAASHPDPTWLTAVQIGAGRGPLIDVLADGGTVTCADTLMEKRWPEFTAAALRLGVRSVATLSNRGTAAVTLSLYGVRPQAFDADRLQLAELLVAYGGALVGAVADYGDSRRTAVQLQDAASSRAVVDQAKGILMHALGCSAEEALDRMRAVSQRSNIRATEVAQRVVDAHSRPGQPRRDALAQLTGAARRAPRSSR